MMSGLEMQADGADDGFTLIETLIAFLILAISLTVFAQSIRQATTQVRTAEISADARQVAERVMMVARTARSGNDEGVEEERGYRWRWTRKTFQRSDETGALPPLVLVTVEVARGADTTAIFVLHNVAHAGPLK